MLLHVLAEDSVERFIGSRKLAGNVHEVLDVGIRIAVDVDPMRRCDSARPTAEIQVEWAGASRDLLCDFRRGSAEGRADSKLEKMKVPPEHCGRAVAE